MAEISLDEVRTLAQLARLAFSDEELTRLAADMEKVLDYVATLSQVDVTGTQPMTHAVTFDAPLRADLPEAPLSVDAALANAPRRDGDFFAVPRVLPAKGGPSGGETGGAGGAAGGASGEDDR